MYKEKVISVVVPAHNEQKLIQKVLQDRPHWIDQIFVIDDYSQDATSDKVRERMETDSRIVLIRHEENRGVGAAICTGYKASLDNDVDIAVVMAGDAQMDPADLENLIRPVALEGVDYAKGSRLFQGKAWDIIPRHWYIGNSILSADQDRQRLLACCRYPVRVHSDIKKGAGIGGSRKRLFPIWYAQRPAG